MIQVVEKLDTIGEEIHRLKYRSTTFQEYYKIFKMPQDESTSLAITEKEFDHRYEVWKSLRDWQSISNLWMNSNARELDAEEIQRITGLVPTPITTFIHNIPSLAFFLESERRILIQRYPLHCRRKHSTSLQAG